MVGASVHTLLLLAAFIVICISAFVAAAGPVRLFPAGCALAAAAFLFA